MKKSLGMFVLMTVICVAVFMLFMAIGPRPAKAQGWNWARPRSHATAALHAQAAGLQRRELVGRIML